MDFVFMLTRGDATIPDALDVLAEIEPLALDHIGFKDVGVSPATLAAIARRIASLGATSYLELVSTSPEACLRSAQLALELGIDRLLGGTQVEEILALLAGSEIEYLPFPGRPFGHPTQLAGSIGMIEEDCRRFGELGCAGVDLLAFRATEAEPLAVIEAARRATRGTLLVAGGVRSPAQVEALAAAGVDAFTVGSAIFDGVFAPRTGSVRAQLAAVLAANG